MNIDEFLSRLKKVKKTGPSSWLACCPAHEDKTPSLSIGVTNDGRKLVHCFAGCDVGQIVAAAGITIDDLFPEKCLGAAAVAAVRRPYPPADVLAALHEEARVITIIASDMHKKREISEEDYKRLWVAYERIAEARRISLG